MKATSCCWNPLLQSAMFPLCIRTKRIVSSTDSFKVIVRYAARYDSGQPQSEPTRLQLGGKSALFIIGGYNVVNNALFCDRSHLTRMEIHTRFKRQGASNSWLECELVSNPMPGSWIAQYPRLVFVFVHSTHSLLA